MKKLILSLALLGLVGCQSPGNGSSQVIEPATIQPNNFQAFTFEGQKFLYKKYATKIVQSSIDEPNAPEPLKLLIAKNELLKNLDLKSASELETDPELALRQWESYLENNPEENFIRNVSTLTSGNLILRYHLKIDSAEGLVFADARDQLIGMAQFECNDTCLMVTDTSYSNPLMSIFGSLQSGGLVLMY